MNKTKYLIPASWRKGWDSNPRGSVNPLAVFKTAALNHSATLPSRRISDLAERGQIQKTGLPPPCRRRLEFQYRFQGRACRDDVPAVLCKELGGGFASQRNRDAGLIIDR